MPRVFKGDQVIGIAVPAHNEEACVEASLRAMMAAASHPDLRGEAVGIVVVLDSCSDGTRARVTALGLAALTVDARNVGVARALGADYLLDRGARWLAFTDADTVVDPGWLAAQLAVGAEAVCGSIGILDWDIHGAAAGYLRHDFETTYRDVEGHRHVHGANLGVSAGAYRAAGGFPPLASQEDIALVERLQAVGVEVAYSAAPRVRTSARIESRARHGFGDAVRIALEKQDMPLAALLRGRTLPAGER